MVAGDRPWDRKLGGIMLHQRGGALERTTGALTEGVFRSMLCSNTFCAISGPYLKSWLAAGKARVSNSIDYNDSLD